MNIYDALQCCDKCSICQSSATIKWRSKTHEIYCRNCKGNSVKHKLLHLAIADWNIKQRDIK